MDPPSNVVLISCLTAVILGLVVGYGFCRLLDRSRLHGVRSEAELILERARENAEKLGKEAELQARDELHTLREDFKKETERIREELREQERRLDKREDSLEEKTQSLQKKERSLENLKSKLVERRNELERQARAAEDLIAQQSERLQEISGLSREQAEQVLLDRLERELSTVLANRLQRFEDQLRQVSEEKGRPILA